MFRRKRWYLPCTVMLAVVLVTLVTGCDQIRSRLRSAPKIDDQWTVAERISVRRIPVQTDGDEIGMSISADGRYVAFVSESSNLVPGGGDTNGVDDVFVHDRETGLIERISVANDGAEADGASGAPSISADGRFVAFHSVAGNLVAGNANGREVYVRDRINGTTEWISFGIGMADSSASVRLPAISGDGNVVAFISAANNLVAAGGNGNVQAFVHTRSTGQTEVVSVNDSGELGDGGSFGVVVSADGNIVAFDSVATNLSGDTSFHQDIFVHDRSVGKTKRISISMTGMEPNNRSFRPSISADGRFVAYISDASDLVPGDAASQTDVFVFDRVSEQTTRLSVAPGGVEANGRSGVPYLSADGRFVTFTSLATNLVANDTNARQDGFIVDRDTGMVRRISGPAGGGEGNEDTLSAFISADARRLAFISKSSNLVAGDTNARADIFLAPVTLGNLSQVIARCEIIEGNGASTGSSASKDSRFVVYSSAADNLAPGDTNGFSDVFLYDRFNGKTELISRAPGGGPADGNSRSPSITPSGQYVVYVSRASNLVAGDTNGQDDIFVYDRMAGTTSRVSVSSAGLEANFGSDRPSISAAGRFIAFESHASNLVANDGNGQRDIFIHDRQTASTIRIDRTVGGGEPNNFSLYPEISVDADVVTFISRADNFAATPLHGGYGMFSYDLATRRVEHVSRDAVTATVTGAVASVVSTGNASANGREVLMMVRTTPAPLIHHVVLVYDRLGGTVTDRLDVSWSLPARLSADGKRIEYLQPGELFDPDTYFDTDFHVYDRDLRETTLVARSAYGASTLNGDHLVVTSQRSDIVPADTNGVGDVFIFRRTADMDRYSTLKCGQ